MNRNPAIALGSILLFLTSTASALGSSPIQDPLRPYRLIPYPQKVVSSSYGDTENSLLINYTRILPEYYGKSVIDFPPIAQIRRELDLSGAGATPR